MPDSLYRNFSSHYTGANVSIRIGPNNLTQAFGISWSVQQTKRPIYGYHDQYFSGVSDGIIIVQGQLFLNFVHPGYLSSVLQQHMEFEAGLLERLRGGAGASDLMAYVRSSGRVQATTELLRDILDSPLGIRDRDSNRLPDDTRYSYIDSLNRFTPRDTVDGTLRPDLDGDPDVEPTLNLNMSNSERTRALDGVLDQIFDDRDMREDLIRYFTGGVASGTSQYTTQSISSSETFVFHGDDLSGLVDRNVPLQLADDPTMAMARPDQFGSGYSSPHGIDILVHFGAPFGGEEQNRVVNYSNRSSFALKDCHFTGESGQIMMDDQPVMEVYNFFARKKETIPRNNSTDRL